MRRPTRRVVTAVAGGIVALGVTLGVALAIPAFTSPAAAAGLTQVSSFGNNPGKLKMHVYVPGKRASKPAVVVAMHGCGGSGPGFYSSSEFASMANKYGFVVIYPSASKSVQGFGPCFDTWSSAAKRRDGGSDPVSIISMIKYAQKQYKGDPKRVFATGSSSGGMMTQQMLALYPDVFKAGASFMGVPFGCFGSEADFPPGGSCTGGKMNKTPKQWGDLVRQANPKHSGTRPRIQLWHGTADNFVPYQLLQESTEQWTNVFGLSQTPTSTDNVKPGWKRQRFSTSSGTVRVEAISVQGAAHVLPQSGMALPALTFFGLTGGKSRSS